MMGHEAYGPPPSTYTPERPWDRQPCDTHVRWAAFQEYLTMHVPRAVLLLPCVQAHEVDATEVLRWEREDGWRERASMWEAWVRSPQGRLEVAQELLGRLLVEHLQRARAGKGLPELRDVTNLLKAVEALQAVESDNDKAPDGALERLMARLDALGRG
jgi:hypothetical protein